MDSTLYSSSSLIVKGRSFNNAVLPVREWEIFSINSNCLLPVRMKRLFTFLSSTITCRYDKSSGARWISSYPGRLKIAFFSVSNEHQEQGVKARNSALLRAWTTQLLIVQGNWKIAICGLLLWISTLPFVYLSNISTITSLHLLIPLHLTPSHKGRGITYQLILRKSHIFQ